MAQAETTLQQRIDCLDRKLTPGQISELASLLRMLGFELRPLKANKPKTDKWARRRMARAYKGIGWRDVTGVTSMYVGPLCPGTLLWPSDIAAFYASK
jgi:hypothetical protein